MEKIKQPNVPGIKIGGVIDTYTRKQADERFQSALSDKQLGNIADVPNKASKEELKSVQKELNNNKQDKLTQKQMAVLSDIDNLGLMVKEELDGAVEEINKKTEQSLEEVNQKAEKALEDAQKSIEDIENKAAESLASIPEEYTKLNDNVMDMLAIVGITSFNGVTWREGYWGVTGAGKLQDYSAAVTKYKTSTPIKVNVGDVVTIISNTPSYNCVLAITDEQETSYTPALMGKDALSTYEYTVENECYIVVSCKDYYIPEFKIDIAPTKSDEIEKVKKEIQGLSRGIESNAEDIKDKENKITVIQNALGMTVCNSVTWREGYWKILNGTGELAQMSETANTRYLVSEPIKVNMDDIVTVTSLVRINEGAVAVTDEEQTIYTSVVLGKNNNAVETYEYTATKSCYIVVACSPAHVSEFSINITPTHSGEILDIKESLDDMRITYAIPTFCGVKNGGTLTSSANGRKGTTTVEMLIKNEREETGWFYGASARGFTTGVYYNAGNGAFSISLNVDNYESAPVPQYKKGDISHIVIVYDDDEKSKTAYYNGVMIGKYINEEYVTPGLFDKMLNGVVVYQKRIWNRVLNAEEVSKLYNYSFPTKYVLTESMSKGLISNLSCQGITETGWLDTASGQEISFDEGAELYSVDEFSEYKQIKKLNEDMAQEQSVIKQNVYPEFEVKTVSRGAHDCTFIGNDLVSFNKPSDGYASYINGETLVKEKSVNISFTDNDYMGTPRELEMKSCDYKYSKLLVGNGRAIKHGETEYTQQGARLYVFYNADTWKAMTGQITLDNCGDYDVIDVSGLGYKIYGFWGQFDDCVFVSCNLFNDIYLIQLGKGAVNLGQGTYTEGVSEDRYNGSYMVLGHWHQDGALGDWAGHGGQYYKGHLYIATNDLSLCTVYKCIFTHNGKLEFEALNFDVKDTTDTGYLKYRYIDGICIKDDILYAQPLYEGKGTDSKAMIVAKM